jgi:hypothetical protein
MTAESSLEQTITSVVDPDLGVVKRFIQEKIAQGAIAVPLASILALLIRMRDLNTELRMQGAAARRRRPPSETMRRLQNGVAFLGAAACKTTRNQTMVARRRGSQRRNVVPARLTLMAARSCRSTCRAYPTPDTWPRTLSVTAQTAALPRTVLYAAASRSLSSPPSTGTTTP